MTEPAEEKLPELHDALLGTEELSALLRDYRACTKIGQILIKPGPGYVPCNSDPTLEQVEELLRTRSVRGVQIRYQFEHGTWCDTLLPLDAGIRLVRMKQTSDNHTGP